jgi:hypothetical protein
LCASNCENSCEGTCYTGCDSTCSGKCYGSCDAVCADTCTGGCIVGCYDGAYASQEDVWNVGLNINNGGLTKYDDLTYIKHSLDNEFIRRSKNSPTGFIVAPSNGSSALKQQVQKLFDDCKAMDSTKNFTINSLNIIKTSDLSDCIYYVKTLMMEVVKMGGNVI